MNLLDVFRARTNSTSILIGPSHKALVAAARHAAAKILGDDRPRRNRHPDYIEIDASSKVDTEAIKRWAANADNLPFEADRTIMALLAVDKIDEAAANAILKSVEEPPTHISIVLSACNSSRVLPTILSRAFRIVVPQEECDFTLAEIQKGTALLTNARSGAVAFVIEAAKAEDFRSTLEAASILAEDTHEAAILVAALNYVDRHVGPVQAAIAITDALHTRRST